MKFPRRVAPILIVLVVALGGGWWYLNQPWNVFRAPSGELSASGTLEADEASITAEVGGRVVQLLASEGDTVAADAILARLDSEAATAEYARARGVLAEVEARRDLARNGATVQDKAQADASLAQAKAARLGAQRAWDDARAILAQPQELDSRIAAAKANIETATQQIQSAQAQRAQAVAGRDKYAGDGSDLGKTMFASFDLQVQAADEGIAASAALRDSGLVALQDLTAVRAQPLDLESRVHQAQAHLRDAEAAVAVAQAARDLVYAGATKEDLALAEAAVAQARAAVSGAQVRLDKLDLRAPSAGSISQRVVAMGQVIAPGTVSFTLVNADRMTLTVYVPEDRLGRVRLDQIARVTVDSFPGRGFEGRVIYISPQAEFTPRNVQTVQGRVTQVFAVKIRLENADHTLKPGMPADAVLNGR